MKRARFNHEFRAPAIPLRAFFQFLTCAVLLCFFSPVLRAQDLPQDNPIPQDNAVAVSYSGQFIVTGSSGKSPLLTLPAVTTNASFVRLEPALLSVSAERIKQSLDHLLTIPENSAWQGKIYLALHPALWTDENVTVVSRPIDQTWSYLVQLPDVVPQSRFMRGMTGALLLEFANRSAPPNGHSAEIPDWLIDGMSQEILQDELAHAVLSTPEHSFSDPPPPGARAQERELDPLAGARQVLRKYPALTFDQLCWPNDAQLAGEDGGVYHASAQLFVAGLLKLKDGPVQLQRMLANLPQCYNWQTAFQNAWGDRFPLPLDLEKWWALEVVSFLSHDPGPAWTAAYSAGQLDDLLSVAVAVRMSSNSLPSHVEIPLQGVIQNLPAAQQMTIFQTHLRDLRIAQFRMAPQFIALTDAYCRVLAGYLGERLETAPRSSSTRRPVAAPMRLSAAEAVKRLNALDSRRRTVEAAIPSKKPANFGSIDGSPSGAPGLTGSISNL